jgi:hypothetical protein
MILALAAAMTGAMGCKTAGTGGGSSGVPNVAVTLAPNADAYAIQKVAVLGYANTSGKDKASQAARYVDASLAQANTYQVARAGSFLLDAERSQVADRHKHMLAAWEKARKLDAGDLGPVCEATGFDAVIAWEVSQWKEEKLEVTQEGSSATTVEILMEMYAPDGTLLWSSRGKKVANSIPYNPDLAVSATQTGEAVYDRGMVPEPPPILPVAQELIEEIVKSMPDLRPKPDAKPSPGMESGATGTPGDGGW